MKFAKWVAISFCIYVGIVIAFESMLGWVQPEAQSTFVITILDQDGVEKDRVVSRLESDGHVYVAANHWPRAGYKNAQANPSVQITTDEEKLAYVAVPVSDEEHDRVNAEHSLGFMRILMGFAPRFYPGVQALWGIRRSSMTASAWLG